MNKATKRNFKRAFFAVALIAWMALIFCLSNQPANASQELSNGFVDSFLDMFIPDFYNMSKSEQLSLLSRVSFIIRKSAHATIYLVLAIFARSYLVYTDFNRSRKNIIAFAICFLYSVSDEVHQYFIVGRSCEFRDVIIDVSGAAFGLIIFWALSEIFTGKRRNLNATATSES